MPTPPRLFLEKFVRPAIDAWKAEPLNERLAKQAAGELNNMAEHYWSHWKSIDPGRVYGMTNRPTLFREQLVKRECPDFQLVWDVADAHKHVSLDRPSREVTNTNQTGVGSIGYGQGRYGEGIYGGGPQLLVELDSKSSLRMILPEKRAFSAIVENVMAMWERLEPP